jgi:hypothetical protein
MFTEPLPRNGSRCYNIKFDIEEIRGEEKCELE